MSLVAKLPSASADPVEHADWIEVEALRSLDGSSSFEELARNIRMSGTTDALVDPRDREDPHDGGGAQSDTVALDAWAEIERRWVACGGVKGSYPFEFTRGSVCLRNGWKNSPYVFQLLLTVFGMRAGPTSSYPDRQFERLSAAALHKYLGGCENNTDVYKFGHPREDGSGFKTALSALCKRMNAGVVNHRARGINHQKDGGLDVVAWVPFFDRRPGQLVAFGQCATGQDWREKVFDVNPYAFRELWMVEGWNPLPVQVFLIPRCVPDAHWGEATVKGGIVLDRCRIASLVHDFPEKATDPCVSWTEHVVRELRRPA
jgi:hypothetical protein